MAGFSLYKKTADIFSAVFNIITIKQWIQLGFVYPYVWLLLCAEGMVDSPPSRVSEEMEPYIQGRCSICRFTAPSIPYPMGTSQPTGKRRSANHCKSLFELHKAVVGLNQADITH
jgi:hypothetical protein